MEDISNKTLALLLVIAIVVSLVGIFTAEKGGVLTISGRATDTGTASFEQLNIASINVTGAIDFGPGRVDIGQTSATLDSSTGVCTNGNWTFGAEGLLVENDGTVNITVDVQANETSTQFVGGSAVSPTVKYKITEEEVGSCGGAIANGTAFTLFGALNDDTANSYAKICDNLDVDPTKNALNATIEVVVPADAYTGVRQLLLTFQGTAS